MFLIAREGGREVLWPAQGKICVQLAQLRRQASHDWKGSHGVCRDSPLSHRDTGSWIWVSRFRFHIAYRYSPSKQGLKMGFEACLLWTTSRGCICSCGQMYLNSYKDHLLEHHGRLFLRKRNKTLIQTSLCCAQTQIVIIFCYSMQCIALNIGLTVKCTIGLGTMEDLIISCTDHPSIGANGNVCCH